MATKDLLEELIILNGVDRPCMYLTCREMKNGKVIYVNNYLRRRYPRLQKSTGWASLIEYGFVYDNGIYKLRNKSRVRYPDGRIKLWQGRTIFTYKDIQDFNGIDKNE